MSSGNRLTHSTLEEHTSPPSVHVQSSVQRIERVTTVKRKLLQSMERYPLVALAAVQKDSSLRFPSSRLLLGVKGEVKGLIEGSTPNWDLSTA
eukprot:4493800-Amphidinium_carterae.1